MQRSENRLHPSAMHMQTSISELSPYSRVDKRHREPIQSELQI